MTKLAAPEWRSLYNVTMQQPVADSAHNHDLNSIFYIKLLGCLQGEAEDTIINRPELNHDGVACFWVLDSTYNIICTLIELWKMKQEFLATYRLATKNVDQFCTRLKGLYKDLQHHPGSVLPTELCKKFLMNIGAELT